MSDEKYSRRGFLRLGIKAAVAASAATAVSGCGFLRNHEHAIIDPHPSWTNSFSTSGLAEQAPERREIRVVSYNCHNWTGRDGRPDAYRIADVLAPLKPDVLALQEVTRGVEADTREPYAHIVARRLGLDLVEDPRQYDGRFLNHRNNTLMSRFPVQNLRLYELGVPGRRQRGAFDAELNVHGKRVRVVNTHFGLNKWERREQATRLLNNVLSRPRQHACVVMGDFNIWWGGSSNLALLERYLGPSIGPSTFPAHMPTLQLDRIFAVPNVSIARLHVHKSSVAREASDHLPIWADIRV
jgi:endonuclease/exonuclease/phosphatase family metal-dependent hydrolase